MKGKPVAWRLRREPASLALLTGLVVILFTLVSGLSRIYFAQQQSLGQRWSARGMQQLAAGHYEPAVEELRAALRYARDNSEYQLSLAEALTGLGRTAEAESYLVNLWGEQPENGRVNLDLARVAVKQGQTAQALRYYHNALYANWPADQTAAIRAAHFELIRYLLSIHNTPQAQSELISLQVFLGDDPADQLPLGDLFMQAGDNEHALAAYRIGLSASPHDPALLAGAGNAAFNLAHYSAAQHYLEQRNTMPPVEAGSRERLRLAQLVLKMDPFQTAMTVAQRENAVLADFDVAGRRLQSCPAAARASSPDDAKQDVQAQWNQLKSQVTAAGLRRNPDLVNTTMSTVFFIEQQARIWCGPSTDQDTALLLIGRMNEGN